MFKKIKYVHPHGNNFTDRQLGVSNERSWERFVAFQNATTQKSS